MLNLYKDYIKRLESSLDQFSWESVHHLSLSLQQAWRAENKFFYVEMEVAQEMQFI